MLIGLAVSAQVNLYSEDFSSYADGINSSALWTLDSNGLSPDKFQVQTSRMHIEATNGEVVWSSSVFSIAGYIKVHLAVDIEDASGMEADDYMRVYYKLNGGVETLFSTNGDNIDDFGNIDALDTLDGGETLQIIVRTDNDSGEKHYIHSVNITGTNVLYEEDFSSYGDGVTTSTEWVIDEQGLGPERWETKTGEFQGKNTKGEVLWISRNINISGYNKISATVNVRENGTMEGDDYIQVYDSIDGGTPILFTTNGENTGEFTSAVASETNMSGDSMRIKIIVNNGSSEEHYFDNVVVEVDTAANPIVLSLATTPVTCYANSNGTATATSVGGRAPLSYLWSTGDTTSTISGLGGGTYSVTITDYDGTTAIDSIAVSEPDELVASITATNGTDIDNPNGTIDLTPTGGITPYSYTWSTGDTVQDLDGLKGGEYTYNVTDDRGCETSGSVFIAVIDTIATGAYIVDMGQDPQTFNNAMKPYGLIYDLVTNFTVPVYWIINPSKTHAGIDFTYNGTDYKAGPFIIEEQYRTSAVDSVIDYWETQGVSGETTTGEVVVPIYDQIRGFSNLIIDQSNESLVSPYFANAGIPSSIYYVGLPSDLGECDDFYALPHADPTWADHNFLLDFNTNYGGFIWTGCHAVSALEGIENPSDPSERMNFLTTEGLQCYKSGSCGNISEVHGSPVGPYTYDSSVGPHPVMQFLGDLTPSTENGSEDVYVPVTYGSWNTTTYRGITTSQGTYPAEGVKLAFGRGFGDGENGVVLYEAGHTSDAKGTEASQVAAQRVFLNHFFMASIEKNFSATYNISTQYAINQSGSVEINNLFGGKAPYTYTWTSTAPGSFADSTAGSTSFTPSAAATGTNYSISVVVEDACGRRYFNTIPVTIFHANASSTDVLCNGADDGTATVSPTNGRMPYTYDWSNGASTQSINSLAPGDYTVTVTENGGLTSIDTVTITEPTFLTNSVTPTNASCPTVANGEALATPSGATPPYTYSWSTGGSSATETGLANGAVPSVTVTDDNGCTISTVSDTIGYNYIASATSSSSNISALGVADGGINVTVTAGQSPYTYSWCNGQTTEDLANVDPGLYTVTITDANGCTATASDLVGKTGAIVFIGGNDSEWEDTGNWQDGLYPDDTTDVIIVGNCNIPATTVSVNGTTKDIYIYPGGVLNFSGTRILDVKGDFANNGSFDAGNGRVTFTGTQEQNIDGISTIVFNEMYVNNTSSTGVNLLRTIDINKELQLLDGNVYTNTDTIRITNEDTGSLSVYSENSYVVGYLMRQIKSPAMFYAYDFPVGLGQTTTYHPATITTMGLTGTTEITATFKSLERYSPEAFNEVQDDELTYHGLSLEGMWVLEPNVQPISGYYNLKLNIDNFPGLVDNLFGIVKRPKDADAYSWSANFGDIAAFNGEGRRKYMGYASKKHNMSFSEFGIGESGFGLPIELLYFDAQVVGKTVELSWSTAVEIDNESFTIEKSDGVSFEELVTLPGAVNSSEVLEYGYVDESPFDGQSYYRLKQTDLDGQFTYSNIIPISFNRNKSEVVMKVYPNPTSGNIYIHLPSYTGELAVQVIDMSGRIMFDKVMDVSHGRALHNVNLREQLASGTYIINVQDGDRQYTERIIIE